MDEGRPARIGKNEALFREVNERLEKLNEDFVGYTGTFEIMCECALVECLDQIVITPRAYEDLRADATLFAVIHGHEVNEFEHIIASRDGYDVVRKDPGKPTDVAEATDPRS